MVDTEFLSAYNSSICAGLPRLKPDDVTGAVLYSLSTSEQTQVSSSFHKFNKGNFFSKRFLHIFFSLLLSSMISNILDWKPRNIIFVIRGSSVFITK